MSDKPRARLIELRINELSGVDSPCHAPALVSLMKRATDEESLAAAEAARVAAAKSTPALTAIKPVLTPEPMMTTEAQQIADLTKRAERLDRIVKLSADQRAHFDSLSGEPAEEFLAKSAPERGAILKSIAESNTVEHTCADGTVIRKSDGALALKFAKAADEALKVAHVEKAARELTELTKRANDTLGNLAGADAAHVDVMRAVESITDTTKRDSAIATLKAANAAMLSKGVAKGAGGVELSAAGAGAQAEFDAAVAKLADAGGITTAKALSMFVETAKGKQLYGEIQKAKRAS